ncbi:MAG: cytochrome c oxidase subunit II [Rhodocyclales bacterium]|nr:cytochrome c oxidase subunit II [Rhodocyclales bacterium]
MHKQRKLWAGFAALTGAGSAMAEKYIPTTDRVVDPAAGWDRLWGIVLEDITLLGIAFALLCAWLIWTYRRHPGNPESNPPVLSMGAVLGWSVIPAFIFMADDFYIAANGWNLWNMQREVPADRLEVKLESGMYSWDYTYPNGVQTQNELKVPAGKPVLLRMTSRDTIHNHYLPDFRIKEDSMPGRVTYLWFYPKKPGQHLVTCNEYCGVNHSYMSGKVIVLPPQEYQAWYVQEGDKLKKAAAPAEAAPAGAAPAAPADKAARSPDQNQKPV